MLGIRCSILLLVITTFLISLSKFCIKVSGNVSLFLQSSILLESAKSRGLRGNVGYVDARVGWVRGCVGCVGQISTWVAWVTWVIIFTWVV